MSKRQGDRTAGEASQAKSALYEHVRQMLMLERLCARFHLVVQQLQSRYNHRDTLHVEDEYDVRDLLQALLTLEHDDVRPEVWTPGYAGGKSRTDFLLKLEHIVVEARMAWRGLGARELGEQLAVDIQKYRQYPDYRTLVCFIYDPEGLIANPRSVESALSGDRDGLTVRVIIAPRGL